MRSAVTFFSLALCGSLALAACDTPLVDSPEAQARDACNIEAYESTEYVNAANSEREFARQGAVDACMKRKGFWRS